MLHPPPFCTRPRGPRLVRTVRRSPRLLQSPAPILLDRRGAPQCAYGTYAFLLVFFFNFPKHKYVWGLHLRVFGSFLKHKCVWELHTRIFLQFFWFLSETQIRVGRLSLQFFWFPSQTRRRVGAPRTHLLQFFWFPSFLKHTYVWERSSLRAPSVCCKKREGEET